MLDKSDAVFLVVVFIGTYAYSAFNLSKKPDQMARYGFTWNAVMSGLIAFGAGIAAFLFVIAAGVFGYFISAIMIPTIIYQVIKKVTTEDKAPTA